MSTKTEDLIREAASVGYWVSAEGKLYSPAGPELNTKYNIRYPNFHVGFGGIQGHAIPIHRFAAYCKFGPRIFQAGVAVRHLDGNSHNNSWANLAIGTYAENEADKPIDVRAAARRKTAEKMKGRPSLVAHLSDEQVIEARALHLAGQTTKEIALRYGVSRGVMHHLLKGNTYRRLLGFSAAASVQRRDT